MTPQTASGNEAGGAIFPSFPVRFRYVLRIPAKNKKKLLAIWYLAERIPARRTFTEAEINDAIDDQTTFRDHATLRRELYNHHLLDRTSDGKTYWKEETELTLPEFLAKYC